MTINAQGINLRKEQFYYQEMGKRGIDREKHTHTQTGTHTRK